MHRYKGLNSKVVVIKQASSEMFAGKLAIRVVIGSGSANCFKLIYIERKYVELKNSS